jgi:hypothetical protein
MRRPRCVRVQPAGGGGGAQGSVGGQRHMGAPGICACGSPVSQTPAQAMDVGQKLLVNGRVTRARAGGRQHAPGDPAGRACGWCRAVRRPRRCCGLRAPDRDAPRIAPRSRHTQSRAQLSDASHTCCPSLRRGVARALTGGREAGACGWQGALGPPVACTPVSVVATALVTRPADRRQPRLEALSVWTRRSDRPGRQQLSAVVAQGPRHPPPCRQVGAGPLRAGSPAVSRGEARALPGRAWLAPLCPGSSLCAAACAGGPPTGARGTSRSSIEGHAPHVPARFRPRRLPPGHGRLAQGV